MINMIHVMPRTENKPELRALRQVSLFEDLGESERRELARRLAFRRWQAGAIIVGQNEAGNALHIVYEGEAKVVLLGDAGREITLSTLRAGDFFGETSMLDGKPSTAYVVAATDVSVFVLSREAFLLHLQAHPTTALKLLSEMAGRLRRADELIGSLALHDVSSRLTRTLLALAEEGGERREDGIMIRRRPTQQDLANMVGTCRETVSRALSALSRRGLVVNRGRSLLIRPALADSVRRAA